MAPKHEHDRASESPDAELNSLLAHTSLPLKRLELYDRHLPLIIVRGPWLVPGHVAKALSITAQRDYRDARIINYLNLMKAHLHRWRAEANLLAFEDRADITLSALNDAEAAFGRYHAMRDIDKRQNYLSETIDAALLAAEACVRLHRHQEAISWYGKAEERCGNSMDATKGRIELGRGGAYGAWGQLERALKHLSKARSLFEGLRDHQAVGHAHHAIGRAYARVGSHHQAIESMDEARMKFAKAERPFFEVRVIADLADIAFEREELTHAMSLATQASVIYKQIGDLVSAARVGATIGRIYEKQGETECALDEYVNAYRLLDGLNDDTAHLPILQNVGRLHEQRGDLYAALLVYDAALKTAEEIGDLGIQYRLHQALSGVLKHLGDYHQALDHHEDYVKIWQQVIDERQRHEVEKRQIDEALKRAEEERDIANNRAEAAEQELLNVTMRLEKRNAALLSLAEGIKQLKGPSDAASNAYDDFLSKIEENLGSAEDWKIFEFHFNRRYPGFIDKLYRINDTITTAEREICYLAALGNNSVRIDAIRGVKEGITLDQIRKIRRKLGLTRKVNFWTFLVSLLKPDEH